MDWPDVYEVVVKAEYEALLKQVEEYKQELIALYLDDLRSRNDYIENDDWKLLRYQELSGKEWK